MFQESIDKKHTYKVRQQGYNGKMLDFCCHLFLLCKLYHYKMYSSGLTFCSAAVGVAVGYIVGGNVLNVFVDTDKFDVSK